MSSDLAKTEGNDLTEEATALVVKITARAKRRSRDAGIFALLILCSGLIATLAFTAGSLPIAGFWIVSALFAFVIPSTTIFLSRERKGAYGINENDLTLLSNVNDKRVVGVLLDIPHAFSTREFALTRRRLLLQWLPLFTVEDAGLLSREQKARLYHSLSFEDNTLKMVGLTALKQIGDENTLHSLLYWQATNKHAQSNPALWHLVEDCIVTIEQRTSTAFINSQLLRPSSALERADTYLRPVEHKVDDSADTLLRAGVGEKRED